MTGPGDSLHDERAVVALKVVAEAAVRFDQAYSFSRLSEVHLTELVEAVAWDLAVDAVHGPWTPAGPARISGQELARAIGFTEDIYSDARQIVANESGARGLAIAILLHVQQLLRLLDDVRKRSVH